MKTTKLPASSSTLSEFAPSITWLNMTGDVTITWDASNRDQIIALVQQKMKAGFSFFVLTPRVIFGNKTVKLKTADQLNKAVGVIVPDSQVCAILGNLGDPDIEAVVIAGSAELAPAPKVPLNTTRRAKDAQEVVENQTVAVRAIVGG